MTITKETVEHVARLARLELSAEEVTRMVTSMLGTEEAGLGAEEPRAMRHGRKKGKLSRDAAHRRSLVRTMSKQLIEHERIRTSQAKAKAVKPELEGLRTEVKGLARKLASIEQAVVARRKGQPTA